MFLATKILISPTLQYLASGKAEASETRHSCDGHNDDDELLCLMSLTKCCFTHDRRSNLALATAGDVLPSWELSTWRGTSGFNAGVFLVAGLGTLCGAFLWSLAAIESVLDAVLSNFDLLVVGWAVL
jgi:hypothetical protein